MRPGDVHHGGAAVEDGWTQRMVYVGERAMASLISTEALFGFALAYLLLSEPVTASIRQT